MTDSDWTKRRSLPEDENCLASMWLKGYAHSREMREAFPRARESGHADEIRYWRVYQPIVTGLLRSARVEVLCDPERATYAPGKPAVIWAWACTSGPLVYWVGVKSRVKRSDEALARDMVGDLVGHLYSERASSMFDLVDLVSLGVPSPWRRDRDWLKTLVSLSQRVLERDAVTASVGGFVLDAHRAAWTPNGEAA
jgi:hypothetical protein